MTKYESMLALKDRILSMPEIEDQILLKTAYAKAKEWTERGFIVWPTGLDMIWENIVTMAENGVDIYDACYYGALKYAKAVRIDIDAAFSSIVCSFRVSYKSTEWHAIMSAHHAKQAVREIRFSEEDLEEDLEGKWLDFFNEVHTMSKPSIQALERLTAAWKSQFDSPPSLAFAWDTDVSGILRLNGVRICPLYELAAADTFDAGWLRLDLKDGSYVIVEIDWPFDGPAKISEIIIHKEMPAES